VKYIFVTGGVVSSLGKGLTAASLGTLLENRGLKVCLQKFDPYLNVDPGTMSPYQHGEVYVLDDGAETHLDLGHYERFTNVKLTKLNNLTSGRVYLNVIERELADGLQERQPLDVAGGAADLGDDDVGLGLLAEDVDAVLDFAGDVGDDLDGLAEVAALALVVEHGLVNLAAGQVVQPRQLAIGEPFVVAQVQIRFGAVVQHVDFAMLVRVHRTWIHVEIRVKLLERDL